MAKYVDGFVMMIQKKNLPAYKKIATDAGKLWKKYGALDYKECVADDMKTMGEVIPFPKLVKLKPGEVVVFSYIVYKSRAHRDAINKKVMKDPAMDPSSWKDKKMPFDFNRMSQGGFTVIVDV